MAVSAPETGLGLLAAQAEHRQVDGNDRRIAAVLRVHQCGRRAADQGMRRFPAVKGDG